MAAALGRIPSGIFVLTARHGQQETGILTSWVQQCGFAPPLVSVGIRADRYIADWLVDGASFTLNVLDDTQTDMIVHFGKGFQPDDDAFGGLDINRNESAAPILSEALAYLTCRVETQCKPGDHILIFGRVVGGRMLNEGHPMIHVRKNGMHY
jgi:flavin reductase (DIM6/NTAB) family NADH-FMN oxidoreductase RutF